MSSIQLLILTLALGADASPPQINPFPRTNLRESLVQWDFDGDQTEGWVAENNCRLTAKDGLLKIEAWMLRRVDLPFGVSLVALLEKPGNASKTESPG